MNLRAILFGTLAYAAATFPLAIVWHLTLFEERYRQFGYFEDTPNLALGLTTMIVQGFILSLLFPHVTFSGGRIARGLKFALAVGLFYWTCHVLAFLAKQTVNGALSFFFMESVYLTMQFGIFGLLIGLIYGRAPAAN